MIELKLVRLAETELMRCLPEISEVGIQRRCEAFESDLKMLLHAFERFERQRYFGGQWRQVARRQGCGEAPESLIALQHAPDPRDEQIELLVIPTVIAVHLLQFAQVLSP